MSFLLVTALAMVQPQDEPPVRAPRTRDELQFTLAMDLYNDGDYYASATDFQGLIFSFPNSAYGSRAKEYLFESCFQLMKAGHPVEVFGLAIPFIKTREKGLTMLRSALRQYPSEPFTPDFYMKLGEYFFDEAEFDQAELEFRTIVELYPGSRHAAEGVMKLAESAQGRFKGTAYDAEPLVEARRQYERISFDFANHQGVARMASARMKEIDEVLAKKDYEVAEFYVDQELTRSARFMFGEVIRRFPDTAMAAKARERLALLPVPEPLPAGDDE